MGLYFQGLTMGLAYVAPIGMQNLFVINSALTRTRRNALITAVIVIFFDIVLSLACFFGIGALMQAHPWLQTVVLGLGGAVVVRIGLGLLLPKKKSTSENGAGAGAVAAATASTASPVAGAEAPAKRLGLRGLLKTVGTACVVTWFNPQAIIDGTLMLGAFSATLTVGQSTPFITGVETASALWFFGITLLVSLFSHRFSPRIVTAMNRVCGAVVVLYGVKLLIDFAMAVL